MEEAARLIAAAVKDSDLSVFSEARETSVSGEGDLVRMLDMGEAAPFKDETVRIRIFEGRNGNDGDPDLILLGDSYSAIYSDAVLGWGSEAGLPDLLRSGYDLSVRSFLNHGDPIRAPRQSLKRYLADGGDPPPTVVWQFSERFLNEGDWSLRMADGGQKMMRSD